jgi:hypothetical protein
MAMDRTNKLQRLRDFAIDKVFHILLNYQLERALAPGKEQGMQGR